MPRIVDEIAEFVTGEVGLSDLDRILTTILFTDIVASTEHAAHVGDAPVALPPGHAPTSRGSRTAAAVPR